MRPQRVQEKGRSGVACLDKGGMDGELLNAVRQSIGCSLSPRHGQLGCRQQELLQSQITCMLDPLEECRRVCFEFSWEEPLMHAGPVGSVPCALFQEQEHPGSW